MLRTGGDGDRRVLRDLRREAEGRFARALGEYVSGPASALALEGAVRTVKRRSHVALHDKAELTVKQGAVSGAVTLTGL